MEEGKANIIQETQSSYKHFPVKQTKIEPFLCWLGEFRIEIYISLYSIECKNKKTDYK